MGNPRTEFAQFVGRMLAEKWLRQKNNDKIPREKSAPRKKKEKRK